MSFGYARRPINVTPILSPVMSTLIMAEVHGAGRRVAIIPYVPLISTVPLGAQ